MLCSFPRAAWECSHRRAAASIAAGAAVKCLCRNRDAARGNEEPCVGLSTHVAQAFTKATFDTRFHHCVSGVMLVSTAIEMVRPKIACRIRPALSLSHNMANVLPTALFKKIKG